MTDEIYDRLSKVLDTLPNGFPAAENGIEIKLLKKIFRPEDAELSEAIRLVRKQPETLVPPPKDEMAWYEERARQRGVDFSPFK